MVLRERERSVGCSRGIEEGHLAEGKGHPVRKEMDEGQLPEDDDVGDECGGRKH